MNINKKKLPTLVAVVTSNPHALPAIKKKVQITLRDKVTGYSRTIERETDDIEAERFMWEEGAYACDCNRSLYLWDWDESKELSCQDERVDLISFKVIND